jgi:hypothetical protein
LKEEALDRTMWRNRFGGGFEPVVRQNIELLTAIGLSPGGSSTVHIYTQTIHRKIQNKKYIEQHSVVCLYKK